VCVVLTGYNPASADLLYDLNGSDTLALGRAPISSSISYAGSELLSITHTQRNAKKVVVDANYRVSDGKSIIPATAHAEQILDEANSANAPVVEDPAYLTLLTQPFTVQIDLETLRQLQAMKSPMPFASVSPLTGSQLTGSLTKGPDSVVAGQAVVMLRFRSDGPLRGTLPNTEATYLSGTVHMEGSACYRESDGLLLSIETLLQIAGHVGDTATGPPVSVIYRRSIIATGQAQASARADATSK
jgi:hypothetical protein